MEPRVMQQQLLALADAMEAGAKKRPQVFNKMFGKTLFGKIGSCALGAAYEGAINIYGKYSCNVITELQDKFPVLHEKHYLWGYQRSFQTAIIDLNDDQRQTRESIAQWLRSCCPQHTSDTETVE